VSGYDYIQRRWTIRNGHKKYDGMDINERTFRDRRTCGLEEDSCRRLDKVLPSRASGITLGARRWVGKMVKAYLFESKSIPRDHLGIFRWRGFTQ